MWTVHSTTWPTIQLLTFRFVRAFDRMFLIRFVLQDSVERQIPIILVGNKCDLRADLGVVVSNHDGASLAAVRFEFYTVFVLN